MQDRHKAILLGVLWFLLGGLAYFGVAVMATVMSLYQSTPTLHRMTYAFIVFGLPFPMVLGWVPAAYRLARGKPRPWTSAIVMGTLAVLLPIVAMVVLTVAGGRPQ